MDAVLLGRLTSPTGPLSLDSLFKHTAVTGSDGSPLPTTADQASLGQAARSPTQVLNAEILRSLDQALGRDGVGLDPHADPADFSPEKVADRVLGFIESVVSQHDDDDPNRAQLLDQAREGVERGFQEARDILEGLGVVQGDIAANIDRTYELIQEGLDRLAGSAPALAVQEGSGTSAAALQASAFSSSQTTSLVIDTLDGDRVTIEIDKQASASRYAFAAQDDDSRITGTGFSRETSVDFSFRVEGELDADEEQAIAALMKRIDKVADKFFEGNFQAAFNKASVLRFDGDELAGFSMNLNQTETYRAVSAYQQVSEPEARPDAGLPDVAALGGELGGLFEDSVRHTSFADPVPATAKVFNHLVDERAASDFYELREGALSMLRSMVDSLVEAYGTDSGDDAEAVEQPDEAEAA